MSPIANTTSNTSPGWYPDPTGRGERYWNGQSWTRMRRAGTRSTGSAGGGWVGITGRARSSAGY